jgi:serine/threonine-protein kinase RsbW
MKKQRQAIREKKRLNGNGQSIFQLICVSVPEEIQRVEEFLQKLNKIMRLDDGTFYRLLVAGTEAMNNAVLHGNKSDPDKRVCMTCIQKTDVLIIRVQDEGEGFDARKLPNPTAEENLLKESGRGIFLMRSMMDKVLFKKNKQGTLVEMTINLKRLR